MVSAPCSMFGCSGNPSSARFRLLCDDRRQLVLAQMSHQVSAFESCFSVTNTPFTLPYPFLIILVAAFTPGCPTTLCHQVAYAPSLSMGLLSLYPAPPAATGCRDGAFFQGTLPVLSSFGSLLSKFLCPIWQPTELHRSDRMRGSLLYMLNTSLQM